MRELLPSDDQPIELPLATTSTTAPPAELSSFDTRMLDSDTPAVSSSTPPPTIPLGADGFLAHGDETFAVGSTSNGSVVTITTAPPPLASDMIPTPLGEDGIITHSNQEAAFDDPPHPGTSTSTPPIMFMANVIGDGNGNGAPEAGSISPISLGRDGFIAQGDEAVAIDDAAAEMATATTTMMNDAADQIEDGLSKSPPVQGDQDIVGEGQEQEKSDKEAQDDDDDLSSEASAI